jgi:hypothetical protein
LHDEGFDSVRNLEQAIQSKAEGKDAVEGVFQE